LAVEHAGVVLTLFFDKESPSSKSAIDCSAANENGNLHASFVELLHCERHLLGRAYKKRRESDCISVDFSRFLEDCVYRYLFPKVVDSVAVVGEDRVDE